MNSTLEYHSEWFHNHHPEVKLFMPLYLETETKISKFYLFSPDPEIECHDYKSQVNIIKKLLILHILNIIFSIKHSKL